MDKMTIETTFFRSKPVQFQKEVTANPFFRSISVQLNDDIGIFPLYTRSFHASIDFDGKVVFRTISVHFYVFFSYLCTANNQPYALRFWKAMTHAVLTLVKIDIFSSGLST